MITYRSLLRKSNRRILCLSRIHRIWEIRFSGQHEIFHQRMCGIDFRPPKVAAKLTLGILSSHLRGFNRQFRTVVSINMAVFSRFSPIGIK